MATSEPTSAIERMTLNDEAEGQKAASDVGTYSKVPSPVVSVYAAVIPPLRLLVWAAFESSSPGQHHLAWLTWAVDTHLLMPLTSNIYSEVSLGTLIQNLLSGSFGHLLARLVLALNAPARMGVGLALTRVSLTSSYLYLTSATILISFFHQTHRQCQRKASAS